MSVNETDRPLVLVADDERMNRELVRMFLENSGYSVVEASNGAQAIELAREAQPSLVMLDINMGGLNGFEVTELLKRDDQTAHIKIALLSAQNRPVDQARALEVGADAYLYKLLEWPVILRRVAELVPPSLT